MFVFRRYPAAGGQHRAGLFPAGVVSLLLLLCACATTRPDRSIPPEETSGPDSQQPEAAVTGDEWSALLGRGAYPFNTPLPPAIATALDGTYVKFDPKLATPIPCRRCPDYMNEGGIWKLSFDKGTFRILHLASGWTGIGSYAVSGDRLLLFNDPKCPREVGRYAWQIKAGGLSLTATADSCAADMRSHNLAQMTWQRCPPAAATEAPGSQGNRPDGC